MDAVADTATDREIQGVGMPESVWLPWLAQQRVPSVSISDLCPAQSRLVVVAPHPDDEILACGGWLALRAGRGQPCLVVAVTQGEASHGTLDPSACARLARRRTKESYAGLGALGLSAASVVRLGLPDGQVASMVFALAMKLLPLLKPDDVVVTTWSLDGHPDHEATSEAVWQAAAKVGCRLLEAPVWMWHWASPDDLSIPWGRLMCIDLPEQALDAKQVALSHHQSQHERRAGGLDAVLVPSIVERAARPREYFFH